MKSKEIHEKLLKQNELVLINFYAFLAFCSENAAIIFEKSSFRAISQFIFNIASPFNRSCPIVER